MFDLDNDKPRNVGDYDPLFKIIAVEKEEVEAFDFRGIEYLISTMSGNKKCLDNYKTHFSLIMEHDDHPEGVIQYIELERWLNESVRLNIPWFYFLETKEDSGLPLFMHSYIKALAQKKADNSLKMELNEYDAADFMESVFRNLNAFTEKHSICADINRELSAQLYHFFLTYQSLGDIYTVGEIYGLPTEHVFAKCEYTDFDLMYHRARFAGSNGNKTAYNEI